MKLFVTYGYGSNLRDCYSVVEGVDALECQNKIDEVCGEAYAFSYSEEDFADQAARYGLTEVPLQAQVMGRK